MNGHTNHINTISGGTWDVQKWNSLIKTKEVTYASIFFTKWKKLHAVDIFIGTDNMSRDLKNEWNKCGRGHCYLCHGCVSVHYTLWTSGCFCLMLIRAECNCYSKIGINVY
jgi:hypothetical protein